MLPGSSSKTQAGGSRALSVRTRWFAAAEGDEDMETLAVRDVATRRQRAREDLANINVLIAHVRLYIPRSCSLLSIVSLHPGKTRPDLQQSKGWVR